MLINKPLGLLKTFVPEVIAEGDGTAAQRMDTEPESEEAKKEREEEARKAKVLQ